VLNLLVGVHWKKKIAVLEMRYCVGRQRVGVGAQLCFHALGLCQLAAWSAGSDVVFGFLEV
jgi:hypothetical protein